ncbi:HAMP domain-containing histidine kinase [bacterium]|nr:HAMP domain-containing histidine kinase [bacterium]
MVTNNLLNYPINFYDNWTKEDDFRYYKALTEKFLNKTNEKIIITDYNFNVVMTNIKNINKGEKISSKFKLNKSILNINSKHIKRSLVMNNKKYLYSIRMERLNFSSIYNRNGYIFFLEDINDREEYKENLYRLIEFLKHDLKTQILSEIMALKLVLKAEANRYLLPEILNSAECSFRILKNYIKEIEFETKDINISRKEISIKSFAEKIKEECNNFLNSKNNKIALILDRSSKVYIDEKLLKEAIVNIIFQINEYSKENTNILLKMDISHKTLRMLFKIPNIKIQKDIFEKQISTEDEYRKLGKNSGLYLAERIILAHGGNIKIKNEENYSVLKINILK